MPFNKDNIRYIKITFPPCFCVSPCVIHNVKDFKINILIDFVMLNDFFIEILVEMNHNFFEQNIELALELNVENTGMLFYLCRWIQNYVNPESNLLKKHFFS